MGIKIIKGEKIPKQKRKITNWPLDDMKVGDSFKLTRESKPSSMNGLYALAKRRGMGLTYRSLPDGGVQVWRNK